MRCDEVSDQLSEAAAGRVLLRGPARRHVAQCLRCQAEVVQYRKMFRTLRTLRADVLQPAPGLVNEILVALEEAGERGTMGGLLRGRRVAYAGGIAAATAAAAGGALVLASRSKRRMGLAG